MTWAFHRLRGHGRGYIDPSVYTTEQARDAVLALARAGQQKQSASGESKV